MAAFYEFQREDGEWIVKAFPFGQCPKEIVCEDGVKAIRGWRSAPTISYKPGSEPASVLRNKAEKRYQANINAGKRGEHEWRERMPKLQK